MSLTELESSVFSLPVIGPMLLFCIDENQMLDNHYAYHDPEYIFIFPTPFKERRAYCFAYVSWLVSHTLYNG